MAKRVYFVGYARKSDTLSNLLVSLAVSGPSDFFHYCSIMQLYHIYECVFQTHVWFCFVLFVTAGITRWVRWVRIIGPVVGTSNKLLGNTLDLLKKMKQHHDARRAARIRQIIWREMTDEEL